MAKTTNNISSRTITKTVSIDTLVVDTKLNVRLTTNYDIPSMKNSIAEVGRITDPIHIRAADNVVLRGNRRTLAGQEWLSDPACPQELAAALRKVTVIVHDVVPGSEEELAIILDDGDQKTLAKTEVYLAVLRLDRQFMSEVQISMKLYHSLARYTKNPEKAQEASKITNLADRKEFVKNWLHGTVGNYMLTSAKMGAYVREQTYLTHLSDDGLLAKDQVVEMRCDRARITKLSAAKSKDDPKNGGKGWSVETGGEHFNALIEQFKAEDRGDVEKEDGPKRPTVKELKERADAFKSPAIRNALLVAAGEKAQARDLVDLDDQLHRLNMVCETLTKRLPEITDPLVAALIKAIISTGPAGEVELALNKIVSK